MEEISPSSSRTSVNGAYTSSNGADHNELDTSVDTALLQRVYVFSANDRPSLDQEIAKIGSYAEERPLSFFPSLGDSLAFTLGQRRSVFPWKLAVVATNHVTMLQSLAAPGNTRMKSGNPPKIGFVFTGQGSQWATMGRELMHTYPVYALAIREADEVLLSLGAPWSLVDELEKPKPHSNIDRCNISQPACTALQIALVELLRSWGINPARVIGHSSGEIAAAYAAGVLDLKTCMAIAYWRGFVSATLEKDVKHVRGNMIAIGASQEMTQALIDSCTSGKLVIACVNSPSSMTVSGDETAISQIQELAQERSVWNRRLKIDVAYHSHHMFFVADKYRSLLKRISPKTQDQKLGFFSSLRGAMVDHSSLGTSYWVENLTSPVQFSKALRDLCEPRVGGKERGVDILVEIGPHSALRGPIRQILQTLNKDSQSIQYLPSLTRNEDSIIAMHHLAAHLFINGSHLNMGAINFPNQQATLPKILTDLPPYQWNHSKRYWHETRISHQSRLISSPRHDLLGSRVLDSSLLEPQWKNVLFADDVPWLRDHRVQGLTIFPMAGYLCMAMEACRQMQEWKNARADRTRLREISVHSALAIPESTSVEMRLSLTPYNEGPRSSSERWSEFIVSSWTAERGWLEHCRGLVAAEKLGEINAVESIVCEQNRMRNISQSLQRQVSLCSKSVDAANMYRVVADAGFEYGPTFRQMKDIMLGPSAVSYKAIISDSTNSMPCKHESTYPIHPITLDVIFQSVWPLITKGADSLDMPYLPVAIRELSISTKLARSPGDVLQVVGSLKPADRFSKRPQVDIDALDMQSGSGTSDVSIKGLIGAPIQDTAAKEEDQRARCLKTTWEVCVTYLNQKQFSTLFSLPTAPLSTIDGLWILEQSSLLYSEEALRHVKHDSVIAPHLKKLYAWIQKRVELVRSGQDLNLGSELLRKPKIDRQALWDTASALGAPGRMIRRIGEVLPAILNGKIEPLSIMLQDDLLGKYYAEFDTYKRRYTIACNYLDKVAHQNPGLRILEIGGGTGGATLPLLEKLGGDSRNRPARFSRYDFTDISAGFFEVAKIKLAPWGQLVNYRKLDIEISPMDQDFEAESYDVVVASDVLHATARMRKTMAHVRSLLKPGGKLILIEETECSKRLRWLPFATLPGWWLDDQSENEDSSEDETDRKPRVPLI